MSSRHFASALKTIGKKKIPERYLGRPLLNLVIERRYVSESSSPLLLVKTVCMYTRPQFKRLVKKRQSSAMQQPFCVKLIHQEKLPPRKLYLLDNR